MSAPWRDAASEPVRDDLDSLAGEAVTRAQALLEESGEFYPFGLSADAEGLALVGADDLGSHPQAGEVLDVLVAGLHASRDTLRATALVYPVSVEGSAAVRVELEHRDGPALEVLVPYTVNRRRTKVTLGASSVAEGPRQIWV
ncbi:MULTISPECIES: hypothetical protein [Nocardioides]|uniref:Uncharacterized protein n=1 Tax=Nocardioides kribbensis TaxID=305517 RepID=A0ABV1NVV8_9ACTN|nr:MULTISPECIES: hypothetical protein [Nocardioides]MCM3513951.1 hypothetical protein [Nocardioides sp. P86]